jgi:5-formyltetrahydrofolate cyclo-ligase
MLFHPLPGEPNVRPLLVEALALGHEVVLPRFNQYAMEYEGVAVRSVEELKPGHFGILEPAPDSPVFALNRLDLTLVPGVAYDSEGRRLGRGKGYYDRLLGKVGGRTCGVAFDWQLVPEVPAEAHDVSVNLILTPSRWLRCSEARDGL